MVILMKIKRRDFFQRDSIPILVSSTVKTPKFKLLKWNTLRDWKLVQRLTVLFVYLHPGVNKNLQNLAILTLQFDDVITSVTFRVKNVVSFCVKKLLHFALKSCHILRQKLLHFGLMLHFASKVVLFRVNVTFSVNCYILRRNRKPSITEERVDLFPVVMNDYKHWSNKKQRYCSLCWKLPADAKSVVSCWQIVTE